MNPPDPLYPDLQSPDSPEARRRVVAALSQLYGAGRASSSVDTAVFEAIDRLPEPGQARRVSRLGRLGWFGVPALAVVAALILIVIARGGSRGGTVRTGPSWPVAISPSILNRAAVALPMVGRVSRLTYVQSVGHSPTIQRVYIWEAAVPGGYRAAASSTAAATENVAIVQLKGRLRRLSRQAPILGVLDGPGDARMLRATRARSHRVLNLVGPEAFGGHKVYAVRMRVTASAVPAAPAKTGYVTFYFDTKTFVLIGATGHGWSAKLVGREVFPFHQAPQLIRQSLRPDMSGVAPAH
jgi:hypothetical protein